ncbi:Aste57867_13716 [Aphanomyces stellatus]|uniref:Aste57867_13716 protein n=1 Tax=Aphanomyces stellatus TaxID=120398 RepID=A0A485KZ37_9STRA|nr:hypothetical protein As57867_013666 [Aphanomyces stellatus]VFT90549.1 Aste57867_13716 [Aphanomyces stellatus]
MLGFRFVASGVFLISRFRCVRVHRTEEKGIEHWLIMEPNGESRSDPGGPDGHATTAVTADSSATQQMAIGVNSVDLSGHIELKVKTLDHRLFRISLLSSSSVPQLKSKIEAETGVIIDRQRLIFRGKVLKNENDLAFYSLENGHTLHLVIRPADATPTPPAAVSPVEPQPTNEGPPESNQVNILHIFRQAPQEAAPTQTRSNDEPDPIMINSRGNATPSGNRVLMGSATISVPEGTRGGPFLQSLLSNIMNTVQGLATDGPPSQESSTDAASPANTAEGRRLVSAQSTPDQRTRRATILQRPPSAGINRTRFGRTDATIRTINQSLEHTGNNFPPFLDTFTPATFEDDIDGFRQQLETLAQLMQQLQPRMSRLPLALQALHERSGDRPMQTPLVTPIVRSIEVLQSLGELCNMLSRTSQQLFLRYNGAALPSEMVPPPQATPAPTELPTTTEPPATTNTDPENTALRGLYSLLERMQGRILRQSSESDPADGPRATIQTFPQDGDRIEIEATIPIWQIFPSVTLTPSAAPTSPPTPSGPRRWDFPAFGARVASDVTTVDLYGLLSGSRDAFHSILQRVGMHMFEGIDLPPMSPGTNREWSVEMVAALQDFVDRQPRFAHAALRPSAPNVVSQLVQIFSPFAPELVVFFIRGTSVESTSGAQGPSFSDDAFNFMGHMARQMVQDVMNMLTDPSALDQVLESLLVHFTIERNIARFVVQTVLSLPSVQPVVAQHPPPPASEPESKRRRLD